MENYDPRRRHEENDPSRRDRSRQDEWGDDPARNRDDNRHAEQAGGDDSRRGRPGPWRGDQDRTTTPEQRARGFMPRGRGFGLYGSDDARGREGRDFDRGADFDRGREFGAARDDEEQSYYRGYYDRSVTPYSYPGGRGNLYVESWTITGPYTGRGPKGYKRSDQQIVDEACQRLEHDGHVDATDIEVVAIDGVIHLRGTVPDRATKRRAEQTVESVYGARDVMNELRVEALGSGSSEGMQRQSSTAAPESSTVRPSTSGAAGATPAASEPAPNEPSQRKPQH